MRNLNTKQGREALLTYEFNKLTERGFKKEVYKDLTIWSGFEAGKYFSKIFRGTATAPICYYSHRSESQMMESVEGYKKSADRRESYKAERKQTTGRLTGAAACADAIRKELKENFKGFKFSVKSETFSGGDSVNISWIDGPTAEEVEKITSKYQAGYFDGMQDMYIYSSKDKDFPTAKYVQESRSMSNEVETEILTELTTTWSDCIGKQKNDWIDGAQCYLSTLIYRQFIKKSYWSQPEEKKIVEPEELIDWDEVLTEVETENKKREKIEAYEQRKAEKIERLREKADKAKAESEKAYKSASQIASFIPMGQPILVGHHSESRHRKDLARIDSRMQKSIEADKKADYYESKAERLEKNNVISSDDPAAIDKLKAKLTGLEQAQELMKACNAIIREKTSLPAAKVAKMVQIGISQKDAESLLTPNFMGEIGFASYSLSNNLQNISTVKKRISELEKRQNQEESKEEINGVRIVDNPEANRIQLFFDGIPAENIRTQLKRSGFRWSPFNKCWQSFRNRWNLDNAKRIINSMELETA